MGHFAQLVAGGTLDRGLVFAGICRRWFGGFGLAGGAHHTIGVVAKSGGRLCAIVSRHTPFDAIVFGLFWLGLVGLGHLGLDVGGGGIHDRGINYGK